MMAQSSHPFDRRVCAMALPLLFALTASGCASNPSVRAGVAGASLQPGTTIVMIGTSASDSPFAIEARKAVTDALARHGHAVSANAPARLEIGLTDRAASTGVGIIDGEPLSPAKRRRLLQRCDLRTDRLTLTYYGPGATVPITRAWSETHQCKGKLEGSIARLADEAVAALINGPDTALDATAALSPPQRPTVQ